MTDQIQKLAVELAEVIDNQNCPPIWDSEDLECVGIDGKINLIRLAKFVLERELEARIEVYEEYDFEEFGNNANQMIEFLTNQLQQLRGGNER
jgi:hypothetical protein